MQSIWTNTKIPAHPRLSSDIKADVAVIGGGMAGILIAYQLMRRGLEVVVLEAEAIGSGQTAGTSAKITAQHGHVYARLIEQCGRERAEQYARVNLAAIREFDRVIERENIACDFEHRPAYLYSTLGTEPLEDEAQAAKSLKLPASLAPSRELPFPATGAVRFDDQAQFHPSLTFLPQGLEAGVETAAGFRCPEVVEGHANEIFPRLAQQAAEFLVHVHQTALAIQ